MTINTTLLKVIIIISSLTLFSCSQRLVTMNEDDIISQKASEQYGYLLFGVNTESYIEGVYFSGTKRKLKYQPSSADQENTYFLSKVPIGNYHFTDIDTGLREYSLYDEYNWDFTIKANTINYVGHFEINERKYDRTCNCASMVLVNKSSQALEHLMSQFPKAITDIAVSYQGPEEDDYIAFILPALLNYQANNEANNEANNDSGYQPVPQGKKGETIDIATEVNDESKP